MAAPALLWRLQSLVLGWECGRAVARAVCASPLYVLRYPACLGPGPLGLSVGGSTTDSNTNNSNLNSNFSNSNSNSNSNNNNNGNGNSSLSALLPSPAALAAALTPRSALEGSHHSERVEFLGDCVLKLAASAHAYACLPRAAEGELTQRRALVVCNAALARVCESSGLGRFLRAVPLAAGKRALTLLPPGFSVAAQAQGRCLWGANLLLNTRPGRQDHPARPLAQPLAQPLSQEGIQRCPVAVLHQECWCDERQDQSRQAQA
jgi:hypothetical protein